MQGEGAMTSKEREHLVMLEREAEALQKVWLRERQEQREMQITANAEVRKRWIELDSRQGEPDAADQFSGNAERVSRRIQRSRSRKVIRS